MYKDIYNIFNGELELAPTGLQEPIVTFSQTLQTSSLTQP